MKALVASLLLVITAGAAFVIGRATAPDNRPAPESGRREIVVRIGDQFRVPAVALFCTAGYEIDRAKVLCNRTKDPQYQVVFERNQTNVGRIGYPGDQRVFPERP
jgi:hypothetical protein